MRDDAAGDSVTAGPAPSLASIRFGDLFLPLWSVLFLWVNPVTVVVWISMMFDRGWTHGGNGDVLALTDEGIRVWVLRSVTLSLLFVVVKVGVLARLLDGVRAALRLHLRSQLGYLLLTPLVLPPHLVMEGNVFGMVLVFAVPAVATCLVLSNVTVRARLGGVSGRG